MGDLERIVLRNVAEGLLKSALNMTSSIAGRILNLFRRLADHFHMLRIEYKVLRALGNTESLNHLFGYLYLAGHKGRSSAKPYFQLDLK